ncbi:hypothetical protein QYE76_060142 [Lolium multiflorum]|uniref:CASP-like protein n=1 Tax=Lolium multiflorum TaxID=4521 RepID=A0AAD8RYI3_LOLMU|nr:hypothetical protein QYE76_060142 [Lolium multiflorum]
MHLEFRNDLEFILDLNTGAAHETGLLAIPFSQIPLAPKKSSAPPTHPAPAREKEASAHPRGKTKGSEPVPSVMFASRPAVHPVEALPPTDPVGQPTGVLMKDLPGMPGTAGGLGLRIAQFAFAGVALAVMASTNDSPSASGFWYLPSPSIVFRVLFPPTQL